MRHFKRTQQRSQLLLVAERIDGVQSGLERRYTLLVGELGIHARGVEVAIFLFQRCPLSIRVRRGFQLAIEKPVISLSELIELAPADLVGRYRILFLPVAAGVLIEVGAGISCLVDGGQVETLLGLRLGGRGGLACFVHEPARKKAIP